MLPAWRMPIAEYTPTINNSAAAHQQQIRFALAVIGSGLSKISGCQPRPDERPLLAKADMAPTIEYDKWPPNYSGT
jgi:hypothetical protein